MPAPSRQKSQRRHDALALLLILGVATAFRVWQLDRFPPGLFGDEAVNGLDALDVLAGRPQVFFPANFGREGLHMLVIAPFIQLMGPTALALRLPSVVAGLLTAVTTYWLGRELMARTRFRGILVPLLAALFLSTSYWHVHFSRFGIRGVFTPLMAALTFAAFWRGANAVARDEHGRRHGHLAWFLLSGVFLGLGVHFYTASRLLPLFLGLFLLVQALLVWWLSRRPRPDQLPSHPSLLRRALWDLVGLYAVAALVFAPLGLYFVRTPGSLTQRASAVSLFNPDVAAGNALSRLLDAVAANVLQFFIPGAGDQAAFYNLPGRPVFDLLTGLLVLLGILACLYTAWRGSSPHLFLLLWFPVMLVPTFLAVDRFPTLPRALGVLPGIYFYPALALAEGARWLQGRLPLHRLMVDPSDVQTFKRSNVGGALLLAVLLLVPLSFHAFLTWRDYFTQWGPAQSTFDAFEGDIVAANEWLGSHPGQEVYLSSDIYRHPSFVYLHEKVPLTEFFDYQNPLVHNFDGRQSLPLPPAGQPATYLFTYNSGPNPVVAQIPGWPGFAHQEQLPGPDQPSLLIASLESSALSSADAAAGLTPAAIEFTPNLSLKGYYLLPESTSKATVVFMWQVENPEPGNYYSLQVQAGLVPKEGDRQVAQATAELAYRPTEWATGGGALSWVQLTLPDSMPTDADLAMRVVDLADGIPLVPVGADAAGWIVLPLP